MNIGINAKKKLLFTILSLSGGGAERVMLHIVNYLDKNKYDIVLVLFEDIRDYQKDVHPSIKLIYLNKKSRWDFLKLVFAFRKILVNYDPETVISFDFYVNIIAVIARGLTTRRARLIISERNYPRKYLSEERLGWLKKWLVRRTYNKADAIVSVSDIIKCVLQEDFKIDHEKIRTIYNPLSLKEIQRKCRYEITHPFLNASDSLVVISAGRLVKQKRHDRLLRAISIVKQKLGNIYLLILGKGEMLEELRDLASHLGISDSVDFVGFQSNPYPWIAGSDIFVLASDFEGFPNVLIEAMACGTPVVSTDCPSGPSEIITNGKNGMLVPLDDCDALGDALFALLKDEKLRSTMSVEGKKEVDNYKIGKIATQYEELF